MTSLGIVEKGVKAKLNIPMWIRRVCTISKHPTVSRPTFDMYLKGMIFLFENLDILSLISLLEYERGGFLES